MRERLTVSMSLNRRAWMPGDILRGTMRISLNEPLIVQSGSLSLYCVENTYFLRTTGEYSARSSSFIHHKQTLPLRPASNQIEHVIVHSRQPNVLIPNPNNNQNINNNVNNNNNEQPNRFPAAATVASAANALNRAVQNNPQSATLPLNPNINNSATNQNSDSVDQSFANLLPPSEIRSGWSLWREGLHLWNFIFVLPSDLPPIFIIDSLNYCKVLLETRLLVKPVLNSIEGTKVTTLVGLTNVQIIPHCPSIISLVVPPPLRPNEYKTNSNIAIGVTLENNQTILTPASVLNLRYFINNASRKKFDIVQNLSISLCRRITLRDCKFTIQNTDTITNNQEARNRNARRNSIELSYGTAYLLEEVLHDHIISGLSIGPGQRSNEKQFSINLATIPSLADIPSSPSLNLNFLTSDIIEEIKYSNSVVSNYKQTYNESANDEEDAAKKSFFKNMIKSVSSKINNITGHQNNGANSSKKISYGVYDTKNNFIRPNPSPAIGTNPVTVINNITANTNANTNSNGHDNLIPIPNEAIAHNGTILEKASESICDSVLSSATEGSIALAMVISGGNKAKESMLHKNHFFSPPGLFNKLISIDYYLKFKTNKIGWCFGKSAELLVPIIIFPHNEIRASDINILDPENTRRVEAAILNLALLESMRDAYQYQEVTPQLGAFDVIENSSIPPMPSSNIIVKELLKIVPEDPLYSVNNEKTSHQNSGNATENNFPATANVN